MSNTKLTAEDVPQVLQAFKLFINQKPDLDPANYGCHPEQRSYTSTKDWIEACRAMRHDAASIAREGTRARRALKQAQGYPANPEALERAFARFSGRLQPVIKESPEKGRQVALDYCTGQYWPTEYRSAAATVLEDYCETCRPKYKPIAGFDPHDISDIESASKAAGSHWFDRSSKRFFRSRCLSQIWKGPGGIFFVSSEQCTHLYEKPSPRMFTVRKFKPEDADISTVGEFNELTRSAAIRLAEQAAAGTVKTDEYGKIQGAA